MSEVNNENQDNLNQQSVNEISEAEALAKFDPYAEEEYSAPMLDEQQKQMFDAILAVENVSLLSGFYDGKPTGIICFFKQDQFGINVYPVAVMLTKEMSEKVRDDLGKTLPVIQER